MLSEKIFLLQIFIWHMTVTFCKALSTNITIFYIGITLLTLTAFRMSFYLMMVYLKMGV